MYDTATKIKFKPMSVKGDFYILFFSLNTLNKLLISVKPMAVRQLVRIKYTETS